MDYVRYVLVYDARSEALIDWAGTGGMMVVAFAFLAFLVAGRRGWLAEWPAGRLSRGQLTAACGGGFLFMLILLVATSASRYRDVSSLRARLASGEYERVEGRVENFVPGDRGGHREESWTVVSGGRTYRYRYAHSRDVPGFHASAGPVRAGARVRIADVDGRIARLEVEERPLHISDF
ncbi:hypothetical protein [Longimicrobium terrae]|uniref:Uncharacterized protein n=1 Tax=Longimicrobium terrae TaxID=1639882 RepID=A0A841GYT7_9BACT|nr:hypothetical protein [Longimicrobium terrae]MBB4636554.1 hypothetical protein [Longimicrobium terrae]MBB6070922.1 hypothetical protein [Longimicrobium terrae]NNC28944.1 hypothetical protein [Longimicrobium terrae]